MEKNYNSYDPSKDGKKKEPANWNIKPYLSIGLLIFIVFCCCMFVLFIFLRYDGFASTWGKLLSVLQPILIGLLLAYLLNPMMKFYERGIRKVEKKLKCKVMTDITVRAMGITMAMISFIFFIVVLIWLLLPQLTASIMRFANNLPEQVNHTLDWINKSADNGNEWAVVAKDQIVNATDFVEEWFNKNIMPEAKTYITNITSGVLNILKVIMNIVLGMIVSVYVLFSKEKFVGQSKKIVYAIFQPTQANIFIRTFRKSNDIFSGFINGKLLDSLIIGIICYICLLILKMPYPVLIAVIVGATNVIPVFGPYIGALPSIVIIGLTDPMKGLYFIIFILILQQVDGNIIGPKILGDSTGLTAFWVIFAIVVGGGFFGVPGMIFGVPVFAVFYYIAKKTLAYLLRKKTLPIDTEAYIELLEVDERTKDMVYPEEQEDETNN